jgi:hypothetical protein
LNRQEAWQSVAHECPRRIIAALHQSGEYRHGTTPRFPAKVLCCHRDAALPQDWAPTPAQQQAEGTPDDALAARPEAAS